MPPSFKNVRLRQAGLTLIELMFGLLILGVLVATAYASYQDHRERVRRSQAIQEITTLQIRIAQYEIDNRAYPATLADVGAGAMVDPWGRAYVYTDISGPGGVGKARKDHKLNPINSDYDLYSLGPDGVTKTQLSQKDSLDDIVRARDGAFIGVAAEFSP